MSTVASRRAAAAAALCLVAALLLHTTADPDLWGHLAFGRQTLTAGFTATDTFSYTAPGAPFVNHEWLSDVLSYRLFETVGPPGLVGLRLLLLAIMLLLVAGAVRRAGGDGLAIALVLALVAVGGAPWFMTARPQLFTFAGFAAFLVAIVRADDGDLRPLAATPAVTALWVNLHGGVVAGLGLLACWAGLRLVQTVLRAGGVGLPGALARGTTEPRRMTLIVGLLLLHVPAALASPYGAGLWRFFAATLTVRRAEIGEWQALSPTDLGDLLGVFVLATVGVLIARGRERDPVHLCLVAALAAAAAGSRRHLALAIIAAAVFGARQVAAALTPPSAGTLAETAEPRPAASWVAVALAGVLVALGLPRAGCVVVEPGTVPGRAVTYLRAAGVEGRLAVLFDWGSYAIWHLAPRLSVSIDGRREAVYSPAQLRDNADFLYGRAEWRAGLDRDHVPLVLMSPRFAAYGLLAAAPDWRLAFADETAGLFVRRGTDADLALARTAAPPAAAADQLCLRRDG